MAPARLPQSFSALFEAVRADDAAGLALSRIAASLVRIASDAELDPIDELVAAAAREERPGASYFSGLVAAAQKDSALVRWLAQGAGEERAAELEKLIRKFDQTRLADKLAAGGKPGELVEAAKKRLAAAARADDKTQDEAKKDDGNAKDKPPPKTTVSIKGPDGTVVEATTEGKQEEKDKETGSGQKDDKGPPTVYGEEDENATFLYAIALDRIECVETTDYTALGILTFGIAAAAGVDDEIAFVSKGVARFKSGVRTPFLVPSDGIHRDVSDGDILSDRPEAKKPANDNAMKLKRSETFLVNRYVYRGLQQLGQAPVQMDMAPFDLDDFMRANIEFTLFEDDDDVKKAIDKILNLLQQLAALAKQVFAATGGATQLVTATLDTFDGNQVFINLNKILQDLISSKDKIDSHDFIINAPQIKAAFDAAAGIKGYPPGASPPSFEYVTDRAEQVATLQGDGAEYRAILRYERHKMN